MDVSPRHPLTWAQPVMPTFNRWRLLYRATSLRNFATKRGRSGRGPTTLISPLKTLKNWGNSCSRPARIAFGRVAYAHRSKLVHTKYSAVEPYAVLNK